MYSGVKMYFCVISPKNVVFNYVAVFLPAQYNDRRNFLNSGPMHELTGSEYSVQKRAWTGTYGPEDRR